MGRRYDTRALTDVLVRAAGDVRLDEPFREAGILATGGFGARLARERGLLLRANEWSEGDGLDYGVARGASLTAGLDQFYGRALPGGVDEGDYVSAAQLYARHALVLDDEGARSRRGGLARERSRAAAARRSAPGTSSTRGRFANPCGSARWPTWWRPRERREETSGRRKSFRSRCPRHPSSSSRRSSRSASMPRSRTRSAACGSTSGAGARRRPAGRCPGLLAAGADAGGIFTGGYGSGLAAALVFGRIAAETALR